MLSIVKGQRLLSIVKGQCLQIDKNTNKTLPASGFATSSLATIGALSKRPAGRGVPVSRGYKQKMKRRRKMMLRWLDSNKIEVCSRQEGSLPEST